MAYLHIGQDAMIATAGIIAIFQRNLLEESPHFRQLFHAQRVENRIHGVSLEEAKSIIVTDLDWYLSSISVSTLARRAYRMGRISTNR